MNILSEKYYVEKESNDFDFKQKAKTKEMLMQLSCQNLKVDHQ